MTKAKKNKLITIVLDGWGVTNRYGGNAVSSAKTPYYNYLRDNYPSTTIEASGEAVGLPDGQMALVRLTT